MSASMLLWIKVRIFIVAIVTKQILKHINVWQEQPEKAFMYYFEEYLLKSLDIWHTHGIKEDVENDIRKVTLV